MDILLNIWCTMCMFLENILYYFIHNYLKEQNDESSYSQHEKDLKITYFLEQLEQQVFSIKNTCCTICMIESVTTGFS
jgi:hypothetical protein